MSIYRHVPRPPLSVFVDFLWFYEDLFPGHDLEHVLPDGTFELIINLDERPRRLFDRHDKRRYESFHRGWFSGTHREYLVIDALPASSMIGAHFRPGGAAQLLGLPAGELAGRVVELDAVWGNHVWDWRERILEATGARAKFKLLEQLLLERLAAARKRRERPRGLGWAVDRFLREPHVQNIRDVSQALGLSHKHFIELFQREVGLTPKRFCRIRRFQQVLRQIHRRKRVDWADVATSCGYFDQAHLINEFTGFSGLSPSRYLTSCLE